MISIPNKKSQQARIEGSSLNLKKIIYKSPTSKILFNGERLLLFSKIRSKKSRLVLLRLFIAQETLVSAAKQDRGIERTR